MVESENEKLKNKVNMHEKKKNMLIFYNKYIQKSKSFFDHILFIFGFELNQVYNNNGIKSCFANIYANIFQLLDRNFIWDFATITTYVVKTIAQSTIVNDILATIIPGARYSRTLTSYINKYSDSVLNKTEDNFAISKLSEVIMMYDNVPGSRSKNYRQGSSRASGVGIHSLSVYSGVGVIHIVEPGKELLQMQLLHSSEYDKKYNQLNEIEKKIYKINIEEQIQLDNENDRYFNERLKFCNLDNYSRNNNNTNISVLLLFLE